jgi:hypothetical protein
MAALENLELHSNVLAGNVPTSWGSWGRVKIIRLFGNPQLSGCLPAAWRGRINMGKAVVEEGPYKGQDPVTAGTGITGFC